MKKQLIFSFIFTLVVLVSFAQERPDWIYNKPIPANSTYCYEMEFGVGQTEVQAGNQAMCKVYRSMTERIGQLVDSGEINRALQEGRDFNVISMQYNIPINKVCEYTELVNGGYKVYVLCQVAADGRIAVQWSDFGKCDHQGVDGMAVLKSTLVPGLGQLHKGQIGKGVGFLTGEIFSVAGIMLGQSMRHTYINRLNVTENPDLKMSYADKANMFTTIRNVSIVAAAGVYIWNVLDAIISKSIRSNALSYGGSVKFTPKVTNEAMAFSMSLNF